MFNEFPYVNMHELNLDWIIKKVKEAYSPDNPPEGVVLSVNGQDGNVILYQDAIIRFPDVQDGIWNVHRIAGGASSGIQFTPTKAQRISGANRYDMYDSNNPPPYPVTSVNGQTGDVTIQIPVQSVNGQTGVVVIPPDFTSGDEIMEFTQESEGNYWGLSRTVSTGNASIYLDTSNNTVKAYISFNSTDGQTNVTYPLLTSADIPSSSGVISINSKTGAVTLYGTDIYTSENSQTTVSQDLASHGTAIASLQQTQTADHNSLIQTRSQLSTAQTNITNLQGRMSNAENAEQNLMESVAILVTGNTCVTGANAGQYVYVKGSSITGITDGLYKASQAIPANTSIDSSYLTAVSGGGLNSLNDRINNLDYFTLINSEAITPTLTTVNLYQGRSIDDYKYALAVVKRGTYYRASMILPTSIIYASGSFSLTEVDSTNTQRWYEIKYVNGSTVTIQASSNVSDATIRLYGIN